MEAWFVAPLMRWYAFKFLWQVIWKREAPPWLRRHKGLKDTRRGWDVPGNDSGPSQEEDPYTVPAFPIGSDDLVLVGDPVLVPAPDGSRVVYTENVNVLDFKAVILELGQVSNKTPLDEEGDGPGR